MAVYLLHIETATKICSVAISKDGVPLSSLRAEKDQTHSSDLNPLIQKILESTKLNWKNLSGVTVSNGPGSYTGLRIGTTTAKALCFGLDIPYFPIPTLKIIAANMVEKMPLKEAVYLPLLDARRMEVYTATFDKDLQYLEREKSLILEDGVLSDFEKSGVKVVVGGNSNDKFRKIINFPNLVFIECDLCASFQASLGFQAYSVENHIDTLGIAPFYLKNPNITKPKTNK